MPLQAEFYQGSPVMVDHIPSGAVTGGSVVVVGNVPMIAHRDIAANKLGALAAKHGIYWMIAKEAITAGTKVHWIAADGKVDDSPASTNQHLGLALTTVTTDGDRILVFHDPEGTVT